MVQSTLERPSKHMNYRLLFSPHLATRDRVTTLSISDIPTVAKKFGYRFPLTGMGNVCLTLGDCEEPLHESLTGGLAEAARSLRKKKGGKAPLFFALANGRSLFLHVTLAAIFGIFGSKGLSPVMAATTKLPGVDVSHLHLCR